jgi:hypothetical protein
MEMNSMVSRSAGVEAELVRGVARQHRPAARLRDVADQQPRPAIFRRLAREALQKRDHVGVAPAAVARQAHRLPVGTVGGDGHAAGEAALGIEAMNRRPGRRRQPLGPEHVLGQRVGGGGRAGKAENERDAAQDRLHRHVIRAFPPSSPFRRSMAATGLSES